MQHAIFITPTLSKTRMKTEETDDIAKALIRQSSGRVTPARVNLLSILLSAPTALNHQAIEQVAKERGLSFDRVTLYRALDWLVEQGIAHRIASVNRSWFFNATSDHSSTPHAHFHCKQCEQIYCLEEIHSTPLNNLPRHYQLDEAELSLQGQCMNCNTK